MTYSVTCYCTYSDLLYDGGRLAAQVWPSRLLGAAERCADGVSASLADGGDDLIIARVSCASGELRGFLPGGLAA